MLLFAFLLLCASALASVPDTLSKPIYLLEDGEQLFEEFIQTYNKKYADEHEKQMRLENFKRFLVEVNEKNSNPKESATFGITKFADLTKAEFISRHTGYIPSSVKNVINISELISGDAPDSLNWTAKGAVTRVKDQEGCGSCWAFSTIGAVEGSYARKHKNLTEFSEQQLVDCDIKYDNGCGGGHMDTALTYLASVGGSETEKTYPYTAAPFTLCKFNKSKVVAKVTGYKSYKGNEKNLKKFLAKHGPLAIENNTPYWLIKNSWGTGWGEHGYIKLVQGQNMCHMMDEPQLEALVD